MAIELLVYLFFSVVLIAIWPGFRPAMHQRWNRNAFEQLQRASRRRGLSSGGWIFLFGLFLRWWHLHSDALPAGVVIGVGISVMYVGYNKYDETFWCDWIAKPQTLEDYKEIMEQHRQYLAEIGESHLPEKE